MLVNNVFGDRLPVPTLGHAARDRGLSPAALRVLLLSWFAGLLELHDYRPVKVNMLSHLLGVSERAAARALHELEAGGYLACGADDPQAPAEARGDRPRWYRLRYAPPRP